MIHLGSVCSLGYEQIAEKALLLADEMGTVKVCRSHGGGLCLFGPTEEPNRSVLCEITGDESTMEATLRLMRWAA